MAEKHYFEQIEFTRSYIIPYLQKYLPNFHNMKILEIGCAEGGLLHVLHELKIEAAGLELEIGRVDIAIKKNPVLSIIVGDITDKNVFELFENKFDLIIMRDTIEHIPDREATFFNISKLLNKKGYLYITFPPRFSGFAGHQQNGRTILRIIPYLHLLPDVLIRLLGNILNEKQKVINSVILNYKEGLTISSFEKFYRRHQFKAVVRDLFIFRPIYKLRFKVTPKRIPNIRILREFLAFGCEYLLQKMKLEE